MIFFTEAFLNPTHTKPPGNQKKIEISIKIHMHNLDDKDEPVNVARVYK